MKTIKLIMVSSILAGLLYACDQKPNGIKIPDYPKAVNSPNPKADLISKDSFDTWVARWNDNFRAYMSRDSLHYFDMPLVDLREILHESPVDDARFYLGMDASELPHLMLVGVYKGKPNFNIIADYTRICPPLCTK
jgi:hypothetical protein